MVESDWPRAVADARHIARFTVDEPGRYRIYVKRSERGTEDIAGRVLSIAPQILTVDDTSGPLSIPIRLAR